MTLLLLFLLVPAIYTQSSLGSRCTHTLQCGTGAFCNENVCRKDSCTISSQCRSGEVCQYGLINGRQKLACFADLNKVPSTEDFCPGGGAVVIGFDGKLSTCDFSKSCGNGQICNPQKGICCTKLRTCPKPTKAMVNVVTGMAIMCQFKTGPQTPCPGSGYCESKTGFCCQGNPNTPVEPKGNPTVGERCTVARGCDGGAVCNCGNRGVCKCECPSELGYSISADGKSCQRQRRRLKEKCKSDVECSAAFSECTTGGCRCKRGFQRDGDGGCKPINYKCPGNASPLMRNDKPIVCHSKAGSPYRSYKKINETTSIDGEVDLRNLTINDFASSDRDTCPPDHYCVAVFDDATRPGYNQGFCCPDPSDIRPICPVGEAHESSSYPDFGCRDCPSDYYCHRDGVSTKKTICCPKPCLSLDDIYHEGQCYSTAFYGDSCHIDAQCTSRRSPNDSGAELSPLECRRGVCTCPSGYSHSAGQCKRISCTVGFRGEPSVDRNNEFLKCGRSSDCSQGQLCDMTHNVCCKGTNRCPSGFEETGEMCGSGRCSTPTDICHRVADFKKSSVCCRSP